MPPEPDDSADVLDAAIFTTHVDEDTGEVTVVVELDGQEFQGSGSTIEAAAFTLGCGVMLVRPELITGVTVEDEDPEPPDDADDPPVRPPRWN